LPAGIIRKKNFLFRIAIIEFPAMNDDVDDLALPRLARRAAESHKGDYGRVVIIGGSRGMAGAVALAGRAALRSGAGLVTLAVPESCLDVVASFEPSYMTWPLPCDKQGRLSTSAESALQPLLERGLQSAAIGPGLGRSRASDRLVLGLYASLAAPLVVDADALNALAEKGLPRPAGPRVLTPHPGEFSRLCPGQYAARDAMEIAARSWTAEHGVVLILKGHRSLITDGRRLAHNLSGNPGMATGGMGDVLTGIVAGLLGQGLAPLDAARLAAHVHGRAGDRAAQSLGQTSMIAGDLLLFLPDALREQETP
jgi:ADP-dependent NAD(P)H-hydrate dehydratase